MTHRFSWLSWVRRVMNLRDDGACIDGVDRASPGSDTVVTLHCAIAADGTGAYRAYALLPMWARVLFRLRLWYTRAVGRKVWIHGVNWFFTCPACRMPSVEPLWGSLCSSCHEAVSSKQI